MNFQYYILSPNQRSILLHDYNKGHPVNEVVSDDIWIFKSNKYINYTISQRYYLENCSAFISLNEINEHIQFIKEILDSDIDNPSSITIKAIATFCNSETYAEMLEEDSIEYDANNSAVEEFLNKQLVKEETKEYKIITSKFSECVEILNFKKEIKKLLYSTPKRNLSDYLLYYISIRIRFSN